MKFVGAFQFPLALKNNMPTKTTKTTKPKTTKPKATKSKTTKSKATKPKTPKTTKSKSSSSVVQTGDKLIILESPNKVASVKKYLGAGWRVVATVGHIIELSKEKKSLNTDTWEAKFNVIKGKSAVLDNLKKEIKEVSEVYLATDPDREGEAIAWFVYDRTKSTNPKAKFYRATFNSISKEAIEKGIANKTSIDMDLVYSQRARMFLDRVVGYTVSPIVQKHVVKMEKHHAAGRVMSVALRIISERQKEIDAFKPDEFWDIYLDAIIDNKPLTLQLFAKNGKKIKITNQKDALQIKEEILKSNVGEISEVKEKETVRNPKPPLTTVSMQQLAAGKLGFQVKKTMEVAQELFAKGFISYHRSDSVRLEPEEVKKAQTALMADYGQSYTSSTPISYKGKSGSKIQDAHTAIQPTDATRIKIDGTTQMQNLYSLIRKRFLACQSVPAQIKLKSIIADIGHYNFKANASTIVFDGFLKVMGEDDDSDSNDETAILPDVKEGEEVKIKDLDAKQKFTKPPAYFNDASLVKALETNGVGRPSTYANILSKLEQRTYMGRDKKKLFATEVGILVTDFLMKEFADLLDFQFTSQMENLLDDIADGKKDWKEVLNKFWKDLSSKIKSANLSGAKLEDTGKMCHLCGSRVLKNSGSYHGVYYQCEREECKARFNKKDGEPLIEKVVGACPNCGKNIVERKGRHGVFYACSGYPACKTICQLNEDGSLVTPEQQELGKCTKCGHSIVEKRGRFKPFFACSNYPACKTIYNKDEAGNFTEQGGGAKGEKVGTCQKCSSDIVKKQGNYGEFFACSGYPKCKTIFIEENGKFVEKVSTGKPKRKK